MSPVVRQQFPQRCQSLTKSNDAVLERLKITSLPEARNALSGEMLEALSEAALRLAGDPKVRVVVLTGTGNAFCAGGDVKGFAADNTRGPDATSAPSFEARTHSLRTGMELSRWLREMPKPTLAVIPGPAAGAGFSLAVACVLGAAVRTSVSLALAISSAVPFFAEIGRAHV